MIEAFEDWSPPADGSIPGPTGRIALEGDCPIQQVITVDGGHQAVPNIARPERQVGFVQVAAQMIKIEDIEHLRAHPMADPREVRPMLGRFTHHTLAVLPLTGVNIPGLTVRQSLRTVVHRFLSHYELYEALSYLVYRRWQTALDEPPSMNCLGCARPFDLPRHATRFHCPECQEEHTLSDYLGLFEQDSEDRSRAETVSNLRAVLEALVLFSFIVRFRDRKTIMERTLFLLDGPLILRAQLGRLVEPIRAVIADQRDSGRPIYLVGVEKTGGLRSFADVCATTLANPGDYFLPDTRYIVEEIHGRAFNEHTYRNRVNYGAKVVARIGTNHVLALNVPTGEFSLSPRPEDLIGFPEIVRTLADLISYSHENALIPIVLANTESSISNQPSGGLLEQFVDRILAGDDQVACEQR
ncbi:MAG: hypothetical protein V3W34_14355 [Phycisphaerae bacterium]